MEPDLWLPGTFTKPLSPDFRTDGDRLVKFANLAWKSPELPDGLHLDPWQEWLIKHILERYPDDHPKYPGQLRYRQVLVSMGRQNGKSVLGAIFALYGLLMHEPGPIVVSLASNSEQARIIYNRVLYVIQNNKTLAKRFKKTTETRGIQTADAAGTYEVKAAKGAALQGIPVSLCLYDEVHITKPEMWSAMVMGTAQRPNGLVLGITTAGDDNSELLKDLYKRGHEAATGSDDLERFGFFLWEAPEGSAVDDTAALIAANPALACGRMNLEQTQNDVRAIPEPDARRYRLNQFVASTGSWLPTTYWHNSKGTWPAGGPVFFSIDRTPDWGYASVVASTKVDGKVHSELVASIVKPNLNTLINVCLDLAKHGPQQFVVDGYQLKDLANELKSRGLPVRVMTQGDVMNACGTAYGLIVQDKVTHADDPLINMQMPRATRKNIGEGWRISRKDSSTEIDGVMATVFGLYVAETTQEQPLQVF